MTPRSALGFTLLELLVVVALFALASAGVSLALRDSEAQRLEREAARLGALLEQARAQSRTSGQPIVWRPTPQGFEFVGKPGDVAAAANAPRREPWLHPTVDARIDQPPGASLLVLGPEPLIPAQRVALALGSHRLVLATDGLGPFRVQTGPLEPGQ